MSLQDHIARAAKDKAEADAQRVRDIIVDIQTKGFDRATAYTNLIMIGGYAGGFAIWNFTRDHLDDRAEVWAALLLTVSLAGFISFEIFKMIHSSRGLLKQRALLRKPMPPQQFIAEIQKLAQQEGRETTRLVMPIWIASLVLSAATALGAVGIFLWSFIAILLRGTNGA